MRQPASSLELDLTNILEDIGRHSLGIAFSRDTAGTPRQIHLPPPARTPHYTRQEIVDDFKKLVPPKAGVVNVPRR